MNSNDKEIEQLKLIQLINTTYIECVECKSRFENYNEDILYNHIVAKHKFRSVQLSMKHCFPSFIKP
jgi:hypothetical protein